MHVEPAVFAAQPGDAAAIDDLVALLAEGWPGSTTGRVLLHA